MLSRGQLIDKEIAGTITAREKKQLSRLERLADKKMALELRPEIEALEAEIERLRQLTVKADD